MTASLTRRAAWALTLTLAALVCCGAWSVTPASAYWSASGSGAGTQTTDDFRAAVIDGPSGSTGSVTISWTAEAGLGEDPSVGPVTYVVQRALGAGTYADIAAGGCSGTFTRPGTGSTPNCTDTAPGTGTYSYRVVASLATWTSISNAISVSVNTDTTVPTATTVNRYSPSTTATNSTTTVQWRATFSEAVKGVDPGDFALVTGGGVSGASIASVSPSVTTSATVFTITVNVGTGEGTLGLNLADNDSIQDSASNKLGGTGAGNGNATGQVYTVDRTAPTMTAVNMYDTGTANGKVNQVKVTFNEALSSTSLKTNWTLTNVPSGGALSTVAASNSGTVGTVTLTLTEGSGAPDTAVNGFTIALAAVATTGVRDVAGNPASFAATAPGDLAKPVLTSVVDTSGATDGLLETGDALTFNFSEPLKASTIPTGSPPNLTIARSSTGNAKLTIPSVLYASSTDMGSTDYLNGVSRSAVFASTVALNASSFTVTAAACTSGCTNLSAPATAPTFVFRPNASIQDLVGNTAAASTTSVTAKLF